MRHGIGLFCLVLAACGGGGNGSELALAPAPIIELTPDGAGWSGEPVRDELDELSNNGFGYTGEIDRYEIEFPSAGRLQISLAWEQEADLDLIVAADPAGEIRLVEGNNQGFEPELLKLDVERGQRLWIFVAGWQGDPGDYTLETLLLPRELPVFELVTRPDLEVTSPRNGPFVLEFSEELAPDQDIDRIVFFVGFGQRASGTWCIHGRQLVFFPRLPESPLDTDVLQPDIEYLLQFPSGSRGPRSKHGEYLGEVASSEHRFGAWFDPEPTEPPRVVSVTPDPLEGVWIEGPVRIEITGALDPQTIQPQLLVNGQPIPTRVVLSQQFDCEGLLRAILEIEPANPVSPGTQVELVAPGSILRLGGTNGLTGPWPAPAGDGFRTTFTHR